MRKKRALVAAAGFLLAASWFALSGSEESRAADSGPAPVRKNGRQLYLMTDKPMYRPGEAIWFRSWEVEVASLGAAAGDHGVTFELLDPRGATVSKKRVRSRAGMATNDIVLDAGIAGGSYRLRATSDRGPSIERTIVVSTYELPRITKELEFTRTSYGPGDRVRATVELKKTGEPLRGARVTATAWLDGQEIARTRVRTGRRGSALIRFRLPQKIARGDGLLTLSVDDGGAPETMQRRIPIVVDAIRVGLYPEGGDLVAGLESRVYFAATDPIGEPVELSGRIVDDTGKKVARVESFHRGMGRFRVTPEAGRSYWLEARRPGGELQRFPLPAARTSGCVMRTEDDPRSERSQVVVRTRCTEPTALSATAALRGRELARASAAASESATLPLAVPTTAQGALRVTLHAGGRPIAERLVYRGLSADLDITIKPDRKSYTPRDRVTLTIETRDASGRPVPADLALAVVDEAVLNLAGDKTGNILAHLYLLPEMPGQTIRDPNFFFSDHPKAPRSMDLLLGTQGWRRFR